MIVYLKRWDEEYQADLSVEEVETDSVPREGETVILWKPDKGEQGFVVRHVEWYFHLGGKPEATADVYLDPAEDQDA